MGLFGTWRQHSKHERELQTLIDLPAANRKPPSPLPSPIRRPGGSKLVKREVGDSTDPVSAVYVLRDCTASIVPRNAPAGGVSPRRRTPRQ